MHSVWFRRLPLLTSSLLHSRTVVAPCFQYAVDGRFVWHLGFNGQAWRAQGGLAIDWPQALWTAVSS